MEKSYRVGTRTSPLALKQVEEILDALKKFYPDIDIEIIEIDTYGDKDKNTPISEIEGTDFFTREIDERLIKGDIDFAVHSAKDLPERLREGLSVVAVTAFCDPYDVLVSKSGLTLDELPRGARIGTSSLRRKRQLKKYRPDFQIVDIRGNIEERLECLDNNGSRVTGPGPRNLDAIVIAAAGLIRLGLEARISQRIPLAILEPHPLQGALAVVTRSEEISLLRLLSALDCQKEVLT